jgi:micrococcal nuclease
MEAMMHAIQSRMQMPVILVALLAFCIPAVAEPWTLDIEGRVVGVHDGDTITVLTPAKVPVKVSLQGIDAPESKQPFGAKAKEALSGLVFGKDVIVMNKGTDRYKRTLGRVYCGQQDVNELMVGRGFAWRYVQYSNDRKLIEAERYAREHRRGLWADEEPVPPWEWRRRS